MEVTGQLHSLAALNLRRDPPVLTQKEAGHFRKSRASLGIELGFIVFACMCASACVRVRVRTRKQNNFYSKHSEVLHLALTRIAYYGRCNWQANRFIRLELLCTSNLPIGLNLLESNNKLNDPGAKNAHICRNNVNVTHRSES